MDTATEQPKTCIYCGAPVEDRQAKCQTCNQDLLVKDLDIIKKAGEAPFVLNGMNPLNWGLFVFIVYIVLGAVFFLRGINYYSDMILLAWLLTIFGFVTVVSTLALAIKVNLITLYSNGIGSLILGILAIYVFITTFISDFNWVIPVAGVGFIAMGLDKIASISRYYKIRRIPEPIFKHAQMRFEHIKKPKKGDPIIEFKFEKLWRAYLEPELITFAQKPWISASFDLRENCILVPMEDIVPGAPIVMNLQFLNENWEVEMLNSSWSNYKKFFVGEVQDEVQL